MKKYAIIFLSILTMVIAGCSKENELKKSVYINDKEFTDLPAYSEWGYNTFGAYYDRIAFISNNDIVPGKVIVSNGNFTFELNGQKGTSYYSSNYTGMSLKFIISGVEPKQYTDLVSLNATTFDLTSTTCQVLVSTEATQDTAKILSGQLQFKRAQNLLVDKKSIEVILSGYFEFKALINNTPITVSNGRFDIGIGTDNFFVY